MPRVFSARMPSMSMDWRAPMRSTLGCWPSCVVPPSCRVLLAALPPTTEYALARIESEAARMASLVDELLLLSRLGEGDDLRTEDVDLADVVLNAFNDAAVAAPSHLWVKDLPDDPVWVLGDSDRLHQLVSNLLTNAWVHTPSGVTVTISALPASGMDSTGTWGDSTSM